ncbi:MAG TPA: TraB/GumN family protein [Saprospiraceae bacterium]|nr:TraB/GumN family protein [Saprospiraceae bacterium]
MAHKSGLLWQLRFDQGHVSYLLGTIHLQSSVLTGNQDLIGSLLDSCSHFAAEVDLDRIHDLDNVRFFKLDPGQTWLSLLSPAQCKRMSRFCTERFALDINDFASLYPMMLIHEISLRLVEHKSALSMDQQLWELARSKGMETRGLEDFETHFNIIRQIDLADQLSMLKALMRNMDRSNRMYRKLLQAYECEDLRTIYQASRKMLGKYRRLMLFERNAVMARSMIEWGSREPGFFTCGAGHLYGQEGVLRLLKKQLVRLKHVSLATVS